MFSRCVCFLVAIWLSGVLTAEAGQNGVVQLANSVGFTGCDAFIEEETASSVSSSFRANVNYFKETSNDSILISVTYGKTNDTVNIDYFFSKKNGTCYAQVSSVVTEQGNCGALLQEDEFFKYTNQGGGALWAVNKGGVIKVSSQSGDMCIHKYLRSNKGVASK